jgi:hypothetical protein
MITWQDVELMRERNKDLLREAENERLIQQMTEREATTTIWEKVKGLLSWSEQKEYWAEEQGEVVYT